MSERITHTDDGALDEIAVDGGAFLERMDDDYWFLSMTRKDGSSVCVWIHGVVGEVEIRPAALNAEPQS